MERKEVEYRGLDSDTATVYFEDVNEPKLTK